jgi:hypothetical protein
MLRLSFLSNVEAALSGRAEAKIRPEAPFASPIVAVCVRLGNPSMERESGQTGQGKPGIDLNRPHRICLVSFTALVSANLRVVEYCQHVL